MTEAPAGRTWHLAEDGRVVCDLCPRDCRLAGADACHELGLKTVAVTAGYIHDEGNVHDREGDTTFCPACGAPVIERDWYELVGTSLGHGACAACRTRIAGHFTERAGTFGRRRVRLVVGG